MTFQSERLWGQGRTDGEKDVELLNPVPVLSRGRACVCAEVQGGEGRWVEGVIREWQIESMGSLNGRMHKWDCVCEKKC